MPAVKWSSMRSALRLALIAAPLPGDRLGILGDLRLQRRHPGVERGAVVGVERVAVVLVQSPQRLVAHGLIGAAPGVDLGRLERAEQVDEQRVLGRQWGRRQVEGGHEPLHVGEQLRVRGAAELDVAHHGLVDVRLRQRLAALQRVDRLLAVAGVQHLVAQHAQRVRLVLLERPAVQPDRDPRRARLDGLVELDPEVAGRVDEPGGAGLGGAAAEHEVEAGLEADVVARRDVDRQTGGDVAELHRPGRRCEVEVERLVKLAGLLEIAGVERRLRGLQRVASTPSG